MRRARPFAPVLWLLGGLVAGAPAARAGVSVPPTLTVQRATAYAGDWQPNLASKAPLCTIRVENEHGPNVNRIRVIDLDRNGHEFLTQEVDLANGAFTRYTTNDSRTHLTGEVKVTPDELVLTLTQNGQTRTTRAKRPAQFAVGPTIPRLIETHLAELAAYRAVGFAIAAVQRLGVYDMTLERVSGTRDPVPQVRSGEWMRLRLAPANPFLRPFAPRVSFVVETRTGRLELTSGPLPSPENNGTVDGTVVYEPAE